MWYVCDEGAKIRLAKRFEGLVRHLFAIPFASRTPSSLLGVLQLSSQVGVQLYASTGAARVRRRERRGRPPTGGLVWLVTTWRCDLLLCRGHGMILAAADVNQAASTPVATRTAMFRLATRSRAARSSRSR